MYGYDHTQQTSKTVYEGQTTASSATRSAQHFAYNLQGRMSSVVNETHNTSGILTSRERTSYEYDSKFYRVSLVNETGTATGTIANETWTLQSSTEFLADHHNHTGYTQTIRETTFDENGNVVKTIDYTFGLDEISQTVDDGTTKTTHVFGHDGHGSVRVLYDLVTTAAKIASTATYSSYGVLLATHNAVGAIHASPFTLQTSLGYSGEHFDTKAAQQYLRARFYNPINGRFNRLDPFAGNTQDPLSLHKYAYVHGDPVQGFDPTGNNLLGMVSNLGIMGKLALGVGTTVGVAYSLIQLGNIDRNWAGGHTKIINIYVTPLTGAQANDAKFREFRDLLLRFPEDAATTISSVNSGDTTVNVLDQPIPTGTEAGYDRGTKTINIPIVWLDAHSGGLAQGTNGTIKVKPNAFEGALQNFADAIGPTIDTSPTAKARYLSNLLVHETAHVILDRSWFRQYGGFRDHTSTGLMEGFPFSTSGLSYLDASQSQMDFDKWTKSELRSAMGYEWAWY